MTSATAAWLLLASLGANAVASASPLHAIDFASFGSLSTPFSAENELPHDPKSFTQGLVFHSGRIFESTGLYGQSSVQVIDPDTGVVVKKRLLPKLYFAEGMTIVDNVIFLLTWREHVLLRIDATTLDTISTHPIKTVTGEGWGITNSPGGHELIVSDGSDLLYFLNTRSLKEIRRVHVTLNGKPVRFINELEFIDGHIFANVWYQNWILKIDPGSGRVVELLDLRATNPFRGGRSPKHDAVLNGIAFDAVKRKLYITGKLWPTIYVGQL